MRLSVGALVRYKCALKRISLSQTSFLTTRYASCNVRIILCVDILGLKTVTANNNKQKGQYVRLLGQGKTDSLQDMGKTIATRGLTAYESGVSREFPV